jgi:glycosyltransferase involved in cell wall biosynthesis
MKNFFNSRKSNNDKTNLIREADTLRDNNNFSEAANLYAEYLSDNPTDFGIWVQRGNCLKDSGQYEAARIAYEAAIALKSTNDDVYLQMGHLFKIQNKQKEAIKNYKRALEINPTLFDAAAELEYFGIRTQTKKSLENYRGSVFGRCHVYDITDFISFLRNHERLTGIQRVQYFLISHFLNNNENNAYISGNITFCYLDAKKNLFKAIHIHELATLLEIISRNEIRRKDLDNALDHIEKSSITAAFSEGDSFVILGAFWVVRNIHFYIYKLKKAGVKIGVYVHDLIPITHPEFVEENTRIAHVDSFKSLLPLCDFIMTVSGFVENEVRSILSVEMDREIFTAPVRLGHALPEHIEDLNEINADDNSFSESGYSIPKDYVLTVGTIEGRKNHLLLINIWLSLSRKYGGQIPALVIVGRWGWHTDELKNKLKNINYLDGKIIVIGNISDQHLTWLYKNCLFTAFPSFAEGWGLPVGESLAHGKPCIASHVTSIPEVGEEFCRYINPYDPIGATIVFDKTIRDRNGLADWELKIKQKFKPRKWEDMAKTFYETVETLSSKSAKSKQGKWDFEFEPGILYHINRDSILLDTVSWRKRMVQFVLADDWHDIEYWGVWSSKPVSHISFATSLPKNSLVRVVLKLQLPEPQKIGIVTIRCRDYVKSVNFKDGRPLWIWVDCSVGDEGSVDIYFERAGNIDQIDINHPLFVGLSAFGFHSKENLNERLDIMEAIFLEYG